MGSRYNPAEIEIKWQRIWDETGVYTTNLDSRKPKYLAMSMFNYPSGAGIHIGHAMNYTISDVKARFKRQQGYESYHPVGWDAFGLPAENYAIKAGVSPQESMATIIPGYHTQYKAMGWSNDWEKEIATHLPEYYKWTQWIFVQMYKHGLAYQDARPQWWCTKCQTVLANEQVIDGKCWRHDGPDDPIVEKKEVGQWFFKITEYADELLNAIDGLDWTESVKLAQKNWIGKSVGAEIEFAIGEENHEIADTLKFTPELTERIKEGAKTVTFRYQAKKLKAGDYTKFLTRYDKETVSSFAVARITEVKEMKLKDIPIDYPGHEGFTSKAEQYETYCGYYKKEFTGDEIFTIYHFEVVAPVLTVFTTRPDTLFGATFMVVAPEHEIVGRITVPEQKAAVEKYVRETQKKSELDRQANKQKTGVFTGAYAIHPITGERIPVWIADYVLSGYGTGAIMAVPAHDERDHEFAEMFDLPVKPVIARDFGTPLENAQEVRGSVVIAYDPKADRFIGVKTGTNDGLWLLGGGAKDDETFEQAAIRELKEESGFSEYDKVVALGEPVYSYYFNDVKQVNKRSFGQGFLCYVNPEAQGTAEREAYENLELGWYSYEALVAGIEKVQGGVEHWLEMLKRAKAVVDGNYQEECFRGDGILVNSGMFDGVSSAKARELIVQQLALEGKGSEKINYKMRDWSVSRQRYWGAPIPIVNCPKDGAVLVPDEELPVILPELTDFKPSGDGRSALARAKDWLKAECPRCGGEAERETDTLDTYIDSSWYMYRYMDPHNQQEIFDRKLVAQWEPVDFYNGADHATAHLLYARFIGHFFHRLGLVREPEPFKQFLFNGKVTAANGEMFSKSKGNGVDPLEIINSGYGADALRIYLMFAAPLDVWIRWDSQGVPATHRFLSRLWNLVQEYRQAPRGEIENSIARSLLGFLHRMTKKVTEDIESNHYNTAIASMMSTLNELYRLKTVHLKQNTVWHDALERMVACVAPFAPHIAEELWQQLGHSSSVHHDSWPAWDAAYIQDDMITIAVQVNGKVRAELQVARDASRAQIEQLALKNERVREFLDGHQPERTVFVPGRLVNVVFTPDVPTS